MAQRLGVEVTGAREGKTSKESSAVFARQPFELSESVRKRLSATDREMAAHIGVSYRTYRRRAERGRLDDAESAKVEMMEALLNLGECVLGCPAKARDWLTSPILSLGSRRPIEMLDSVRSYERVKNKLLQIENGTF